MLTLCHRLYYLLQGIKGVHLLIIWQPAWERLRSSRQSITEVSWVSAQGTLQGWLILGLKLGFCSNMEYNIYLKGILLTHTAFSLSTYTHRSMCPSVSVFLLLSTQTKKLYGSRLPLLGKIRQLNMADHLVNKSASVQRLDYLCKVSLARFTVLM